MDSIRALRAQIRFHLDRMSDLNAHHEFEHLCTDLARIRFTPLIIPATGPVSVAGDAGRDAESIRIPLPVSKQDDMILGGKVVLGCTTQKQKLRSKIESDIRKICKSRDGVKAIYYFTVAPLPIGTRQSLARWAAKEFGGVVVELLDGEAISTQLSDADLFWIACEYLHVSFDSYPYQDLGEDENWYADFRERWLIRGASPNSLSDLFQIMAGTRHSTKSASAKMDAAGWLRVIDDLATQWKDKPVECDLLYALIMGRWYLKSTLKGCESHIRRFFVLSVESQNVNICEHAVTMHTLSAAATHNGHANLNEEELNEWNDKLTTTVESKLSAKGRSSSHMASWWKVKLFKMPTTQLPPPKDLFESHFAHCLSKCVSFAAESPLFPVELLAYQVTRLMSMVDYVGDSESVLQSCHRLDKLVALRAGEAAMASVSRDRALVFHARGDYVNAINELHRARVGWSQPETLRGTLLACLLLSDCYNNLGLTRAAKYFTVCGAFLAIQVGEHSEKDLSLPLVVRAIYSDFRQGLWHDLIKESQTCALVHSAYSVMPEELEQHPEYVDFLKMPHIIVMYLLSRAPAVARVVAKDFEEAGVGSDVYDVAEETAKSFSNLNDDVDKTLKNSMVDRPFPVSDKTRAIRWNASGVEWTVVSRLDEPHTTLVDEFIAILQCFIVQLESADLVFLPGSVKIQVQVSQDSDADVQPLNEPGSVGVRLKASANSSPDNYSLKRGQIAAAAWQCLGIISLLGDTQLDQVFARLGEEEFYKLTDSGVDYEECYQYLFGPYVVDKELIAAIPPIEGKWDASESSYKRLPAKVGTGPTFDRTDAIAAVSERYANTKRLLQPIADELLGNQELKDALEAIPRSDFADWEVQASVLNAALSYLCEKEGRSFLNDECKELFRMVMSGKRVLTPNDVAGWAPTSKAIQATLDANAVSYLPRAGLRLRHRTTDWGALRRLLIERYHWKEMDVDHDRII